MREARAVSTPDLCVCECVCEEAFCVLFSDLFLEVLHRVAATLLPCVLILEGGYWVAGEMLDQWVDAIGVFWSLLPRSPFPAPSSR